MDIVSAFATFAGRAAVVSIAVSTVLTLVKLSGVGQRLQESKVLARLAVLGLVAGGAALSTWQATGHLSWEAWGPVFWQSLLGAEFSYQWLLKRLEQMQHDADDDSSGMLDMEVYGT